MEKEYLEDCKTHINSLDDNFTIKVDDYEFIYFDYTKDFENIKIEVVNERFINNINDMMNYRDGIVISVASELDYWSKDDLLNEIETRIESLEAEERFYTSL